jgi:putative transcriptional regulator
VTKEGVDWLISETEELRMFLDHVSEDVVGQVEIETAIATTNIREGETVSLSMGDGVLRAMAGSAGTTTAIAVTDAEAGRDVGVTNFEGMLEYDLGTVTAVSVPRVQDGGSSAVDTGTVSELADERDLLAVAGTEALAVVAAADLAPDIRFGTPEATQEAAVKGLDVLLVATTTRLSRHTDLLREQNLSYEVIEAGDEEPQ